MSTRSTIHEVVGSASATNRAPGFLRGPDLFFSIRLVGCLLSSYIPIVFAHPLGEMGKVFLCDRFPHAVFLLLCLYQHVIWRSCVSDGTWCFQDRFAPSRLDDEP